MRAPVSIFLLALPMFAVACFSPDYGSPGFYCHPDDNPACPDGQQCIANRCIGGTSTGGGFDMGSGIVPKSSTYTGPHMDPGLDISKDKCSDAMLEPNNDLAHAIPGLTQQLTIVIDKGGQTLGTTANPLAICPTGSKDLDFYQFDTPASIFAVVKIAYDVKYGDLDVGIFKPDGSLVAGDGSAVTDGCVTTPLPTGSYYVGVGGANNVDVNRYTLSVRFFSQMQSCTAPVLPMPDMAF